MAVSAPPILHESPSVNTWGLFWVRGGGGAIYLSYVNEGSGCYTGGNNHLMGKKNHPTLSTITLNLSRLLIDIS